jgi:hypothetical protein
VSPNPLLVLLPQGLGRARGARADHSQEARTFRRPLPRGRPAADPFVHFADPRDAAVHARTAAIATASGSNPGSAGSARAAWPSSEPVRRSVFRARGRRARNARPRLRADDAHLQRRGKGSNPVTRRLWRVSSCLRDASGVNNGRPRRPEPVPGAEEKEPGPHGACPVTRRSLGRSPGRSAHRRQGAAAHDPRVFPIQRFAVVSGKRARRPVRPDSGRGRSGTIRTYSPVAFHRLGAA